MRKLLVFSVLLSCTTFTRAWGPPSAALTLTSDSRTVTLSTTNAIPTKILTQDGSVQRTYLISASTCSVFISSVSTGITYASPAIPGNGAATNPPIIFALDGPYSAFAGQLYGASNCNTPPSLVIIRSK